MSPTVFRLVVAASLLLPFAGSCIDALFPGLISPALKKLVEAEPLSPFYLESWFISVTIALAVIVLVGAVGLALFKSWGRTLSLWGTPATLFYFALLGPSVASGLAGALSQAAAILWGVALAIAYFSPLHARFVQRNDA